MAPLHQLLPGFRFLPVAMKQTPFTSCIIMAQKIRNSYFPCLSVCIYHNLWHPVGTDLGTTQLSKNYHYNIFLMDREEQNLSFAMSQLLCFKFITSAYAVRYYFSEIATTKQFVWCSAPPFSFSLLYPMHHKKLLTSRVTSTYTLSITSEYKSPSTFSNQELNYCLFFQMHINLCHFIINWGTAICWFKQMQLLKNYGA